MASLTLEVTSPTQNSTVSRGFTVRGSVLLQESPFFQEGNIRVSIQFHPSLPPEIAQLQGRSGNWTVTSPANIPPGQLTLVVRASVGLVNRLPPSEGGDDHFTIDSNTINRVVTLPTVHPTLTINPIVSPQVTDNLPTTLTISGSAVGHDAPISVVQYAIVADGAGNPTGTVVNNGGNYSSWSVTLPVPPGQHRLMFTAWDGFGNGRQAELSFEVRPQTPIAVPPGARTTLSGVPTTSSITSWSRLEPQGTDADSGTSSSARVFDPLWFMARQWQMGEFQGEDAGTPIQVRVRATNTKITRRYCGELPKLSGTNPQSVGGLSYDPKLAPLEVIAERRRMRAADKNDPRMLRFAVESGLYFLRMIEPLPLSQNYRARFTSMFALARPANMDRPEFDAATRLYIETMVGRALDGRALAALLRVPVSGLALLVNGIPAADKPSLQSAALSWLIWYNKFCSEPANAADDAWNPSRLEYSLAVGAGWSTDAKDEMTLMASEIDGSPLDWSSFDVHALMRLGGAADQGVSTLVQATIPAPLTFPGAPVPRFWEMEDAHIAYGLLPVGLTDIAHLMMINYASTYGNDWFVVPLTLPVGSLTRVDSLVVTDTFGVRSLISPINDPNFSLWQSSYAVAPAGTADAMAAVATNCFFLAPTLGQSLDSAPVEDVLLMRDEMANVAWGIERTIESPLEQPIKRQDLRAVESGSDDGPSSNDLPQYRLATSVPANWIPFLPVQVPNPSLPPQATRWILSRLKRAAMLQPDGSSIKHEATTQALSAAQDLLLYDEEVPRDGTHITRRRRISRWADGSTWLWTAFRNESGQGEGSSGLKFDQVVAKKDEP